MWLKVSVSLIKKHLLFIQEKFQASKSFWKIYPLMNLLLVACMYEWQETELVVSYKWKYVHEVLVNCLFKPAQEKCG